MKTNLLIAIFAFFLAAGQTQAQTVTDKFGPKPTGGSTPTQQTFISTMDNAMIDVVGAGSITYEVYVERGEGVYQFVERVGGVTDQGAEGKDAMVEQPGSSRLKILVFSDGQTAVNVSFN